MADDASNSLLFIDYLFDVHDNKPRIVLPRSNPYEDYDEKKFRERFRLSKATVALVLTEVSWHVKSSASITLLACNYVAQIHQ